MARSRRPTPADLEADLRARGLLYPDTYEESPWGDRVVKVSNKIFMFVSSTEDHLSLTVRLPHSAMDALQLPFASPTGYGLGKSGWVSFKLDRDEEVVLPAMYAWIDESYRSIAPKAVVKQLPASGPPPPAAASKAPPPPVFAHVLLVCEDPLRAQRAVQGWRRLGMETAQVLSLAEAGRAADHKVDAWIIDLGRQWQTGAELARGLLTPKKPPRVSLCGVRDAKMERELAVRLPDSVALSRHPPGDPQFTAWLKAWLKG